MGSLRALFPVRGSPISVCAIFLTNFLVKLMYRILSSYELNPNLSHDVTSGSDITPYNRVIASFFSVKHAVVINTHNICCD